MKRLGIFYCYDEQGIIDDYILYLLEDISKNLDELCIVTNGKLTSESQEKLKKYINSVIIRPNIGFDAGGWRDVMVEYYGFDKLSEFDEVILFNDSFFGPLYPFKTIFDKMDNENVDFWGITYQCGAPKSNKLCPYKELPDYIHTYFMAFRKNILTSSEFQKYWENLPDYKKANELKFKHKVVLTKHFSDLGFKWKTYSEINEESHQKSMDLLSFDMYEEVVYNKVPILKRKAFTMERKFHLDYGLVTEISKTIDYLKENSLYDVSLIYKYLLRTMDPNDIVTNLNLVKIFPKHNVKFDKITDKKVLVIVHLYYIDLWEYAFNYLKNIPEYIDILITTDSNEKKEFFEENIVKHLNNNCKVIKIVARGRDMASLLVASRDIVKDYYYFCFVHDKRPHANDYVTWAKTFRDVLWENNLASEDYINSIIREFDENPSVGLLVPPRIYHGNFFHGYVNNYWVMNYEVTINLLEQMGINTPILKSNPPLSLGNCFWARYDAIKPIFDLYLDYDDFPLEPLPLDGTISHSIERVYGYVVASNGFLTEFVMTDEYAQSGLFNYSYMFHETLEKINLATKNNHWFGSFSLFYNSIKKFFRKNSKK